jgi:hypothetical protein
MIRTKLKLSWIRLKAPSMNVFKTRLHSLDRKTHWKEKRKVRM